MRITMPRGDYKPIRFNIKNKEGRNCNIDFDEIYVTFKKDTQTKDVLFQKKLSDKTIKKDEDGYCFGIFPEDTNNLDYEEYSFDIQIHKEEPLIKQTILIGTLELTEEVTFKENEV